MSYIPISCMKQQFLGSHNLTVSLKFTSYRPLLVTVETLTFDDIYNNNATVHNIDKTLSILAVTINIGQRICTVSGRDRDTSLLCQRILRQFNVSILCSCTIHSASTVQTYTHSSFVLTLSFNRIGLD